MTETTGTIIKLLSGLTSPKACVKYLTVACFLVVSWKYLYVVINSTNIPKEQISIIILLIGVGTGSIVGHFIGFIGELGWKKYASLKEEKEIEEKKRIKKEDEKKQKIQHNEELIENFKIALSHLQWDQIEALRELTLKNKNLDLSRSEYAALAKNGYIQKIINVASSIFLVQINPLIGDIVAEQWKEEISENIEAFYHVQTIYAEPLLELMKLENREENSGDTIPFVCQPRVNSNCKCTSNKQQAGLGIFFKKSLVGNMGIKSRTY